MELLIMNMTKEYSRSNAYFLGQLSAIAYDTPDVEESKVNELGLTNFKFFDKENTQAFTAQDDDNFYISIAGTNELADWITNLNTKLRQAIAVHEGFYNATSLIFGGILTELKDNLTLKRGGRRRAVWITGHSLGGAIAGEISRRMWILEVNNSVYNFGAPRWCNQTQANWYQSVCKGQYHRYVNNNDIITRLPFRVMDYAHIKVDGGFHYFDQDGQQNDDIGWLAKLFDRIEGRLEHIGKIGTDGIDDHYPMQDEYLTRLRNNRS